MKESLNEKLALIQAELKTKKSRYNSFGKYYFRSAEDILEAIKPFLVKYGVTVTVSEELIADGVIKTSALITDGLNTYGATAIVGVDMEQKGMQMPQRYGSASSYGKKYALGNLFLIDDTQDSDATNTHDKKPFLNKNTPQFKKVLEAIENGYTLDNVKSKYNLSKEVESLLTKNQ
jgi:hypothetical protein